MRLPSSVVVAAGGNFLARQTGDDSLAERLVRAADVAAAVADLVCAGTRVAVTHGNGPTVGDIVLRGEIASAEVAPEPLFMADADSEGGLGLLLQQAVTNELARRRHASVAATVITQVRVDANDPAFSDPSKPIGRLLDAKTARARQAEHGWTIAPQGGGLWRRVVASPLPVAIVEIEAIDALMRAGIVPIACGGGGVPVVTSEDGALRGIDAVIDKDWSSALLGQALGAEMLIILMDEPCLWDGWRTASASRVDSLSAPAARDLLASGRLATGSIAPKVAASAHFACHYGKTALLTNVASLPAALVGKAGTRITA